MLRAALRIFLGWSGAPGPELLAPTEWEHEKPDRPIWLMALPPLVLLTIALSPFEAVAPVLGAAAARLSQPEAPPLALPAMQPEFPVSLLLTGLMVLLAVLRRRPLARSARALVRVERWSFGALQALHSGLIGDYATWMIVGLAVFAAARIG